MRGTEPRATSHGLQPNASQRYRRALCVSCATHRVRCSSAHDSELPQLATTPRIRSVQHSTTHTPQISLLGMHAPVAPPPPTPRQALRISASHSPALPLLATTTVHGLLTIIASIIYYYIILEKDRPPKGPLGPGEEDGESLGEAEACVLLG